MARRIVIDAPAEDPVQVDGDLGAQLPIVVEADAEAIPLIRVPSPEA